MSEPIAQRYGNPWSRNVPMSRATGASASAAGNRAYATSADPQAPAVVV